MSYFSISEHGLYEQGIYTGAKQSDAKALKMADVELQDIDIYELYDCYTYTVLVTLEDYGFCEKGDGGAFKEKRDRLRKMISSW